MIYLFLVSGELRCATVWVHCSQSIKLVDLSFSVVKFLIGLKILFWNIFDDWLLVKEHFDSNG